MDGALLPEEETVKGAMGISWSAVANLAAAGVLMVAASGCVDAPPTDRQAVPGSTGAVGEMEGDLWPMENGYLCMLHNPVSFDDVRVMRLVFDYNLLKATHDRAAVAWKSPDAYAAQLDRYKCEVRELERLTYPVRYSLLLQEVARSRPGAKERLVVGMYCFGNWVFWETERKGDYLVRKRIPTADRAAIRKYFFLAFDTSGKEWDSQAQWDWRWARWVSPKRVRNRPGDGSRSMVLEWRGRKYSGTEVLGGRGLAVPGLGMLVTGDLRTDIPRDQNSFTAATTRLVVPSKKLLVVDDRMQFKIGRNPDRMYVPRLPE